MQLKDGGQVDERINEKDTTHWIRRWTAWKGRAGLHSARSRASSAIIVVLLLALSDVTQPTCYDSSKLR